MGKNPLDFDGELLGEIPGIKMGKLGQFQAGKTGDLTCHKKI